MYTVIHNHDRGEGGADVTILANKKAMRKYCLDYLASIPENNGFILDSDEISEKDLDELKVVCKYAAKEMNYLKTNRDPKKISAYHEYPLDKLIELVLKYDLIINDACSGDSSDEFIVDILYGENITSKRNAKVVE